MKKKIIIISLVIAFIISVIIIGFYIYIDYRDSKISLINESIEIEYGESYNPSINDLIDMNKFDFINLEKISVNNEITINNEKGYGFIEYEDLDDIFVHYSAIIKDGYKTLKEGSLVSFKLIETSKGLQAVDVCEKELTTI